MGRRRLLVGAACLRADTDGMSDEDRIRITGGNVTELYGLSA